MAKAKQQPKKTLYHSYFCGENIGEADGFFEIKDGKLELVDSWSLNDAHWRSEYMTGILNWAGVEVTKLPEKYAAEGEKLIAVCWGLEGDDGSEESEEPEDVYTTHTASLSCQAGNSDKVYVLRLEPDTANFGYRVEGDYGRRGGKIKTDVKGTQLSYADAKTIYDKILAEKLKKGYEYADQDEDYEDEEDY
jgi:predicted DNA-binding WGR domain protein